MTIIGIDLGTTNSACGIWKNGQVELIPNRLGDLLTPSVVHINKNEISVGKVAKEKLITDSTNTIAVFKRLMGTNYQIAIGKKNYTAIELSSLIISSLKEDAEAYLSEKVTEAVISVPAYFNDNQRLATKKAAELAGLTVERLINEPTAAAIAYGLHDKEDGSYLILDLGGGTFDVSLIEFFDGVMEVHASSGDNYLGGEDFVESLLKQFLKDKELSKDQLSPYELQLLMEKLEQLKRKISKNETFTIKLPTESQEFEWSINYEQFKEVVMPLLLRVRSPIQRTISDSGMGLNEIDEVILVGGATKLHLFKQMITQLFKRMPSSHLNPDLVVAMGASIQAGLKSKNKELDDIVLTDVAPYSLGIEIVDQEFSPIIERNSTVPISRVSQFHTVNDKQKSIEVSIYQGESRKVTKNILLGQLEVQVPPKPAGEETIDVRFSYDTNGLLEVDVTVNSTQKKYNKSIVNSNLSLTDSDIEASRSKLSKMKFHPRETEANRAILARGERLYEESLGEKRQTVSSVMKEFETALESQNDIEIKKAQLRVNELLDSIEQGDIF